MSGTGDIVVNLQANASQFNRGMDSAKSSVKGFGSVAVSSLKSVANVATMALGAVTVAVAGAGAAVYGLTGRMAELAGMNDKAAQFGVSVKFLQQLEFAADQSGVSAETLTKSISKLTIAVGNAGGGNKAAMESFGKLGIDFEKLKSMSPEKQFMEVAKAISALPTAADKAAASVAIFGKSGLEMTTLFAGGLGDITALMKEAGELGIGLNADDIARIAAADDAMQKMKASFGALVDQAIVGLAPTFEKIATTIKEWIVPLTKFMDGFNAMENQAKWIKDVLQAAMDVAFQHIVVRWDDTMDLMAKKAKEFGGALRKALSTGDTSGLTSMMASSAQQRFNEKQLERAEKKLGRLLRQPGIAGRNQDAADEAAAANAPKPPPPPSPTMWQQMLPMVQQAMPWLATAGKVGTSMVGQATNGIGAAKAVAPEEYKTRQVQYASAATRGSSDAFKTIIQRTQKDPQTKAMTTMASQVQKQTPILQQIANNTTPRFAPEF